MKKIKFYSWNNLTNYFLIEHQNNKFLFGYNHIKQQWQTIGTGHSVYDTLFFDENENVEESTKEKLINHVGIQNMPTEFNTKIEDWNILKNELQVINW